MFFSTWAILLGIFCVGTEGLHVWKNSCKLKLLFNRLPPLIFAYICKYCYWQDFEKERAWREERKISAFSPFSFNGVISFLSVRVLTLMKQAFIFQFHSGNKGFQSRLLLTNAMTYCPCFSKHGKFFLGSLFVQMNIGKEGYQYVNTMQGSSVVSDHA